MLTQSGMSGSWSYWCWGRRGSWMMEKPEMDECLHGTPCGQRCRPAPEPEWNWTISLLPKPPVHWKGKHCSCWEPRIAKIELTVNKMHTYNGTIVFECDMHLPLWRMTPAPGRVVEMPFGREASKQLLELACDTPGNSWAVWPSYLVWNWSQPLNRQQHQKYNGRVSWRGSSSDIF